MDQRTGQLLIVLFITVYGHGTEGDRDFKMCGTFHHKDPLPTLDVDIKVGCSGINISANASTLSIHGSIAAECIQSQVWPLPHLNSSSSSFCVVWEPLLDKLMVEISGKTFPVCNARGLQAQCCTHHSHVYQTMSELYGIVNGSIQGDVISTKVMAVYGFKGDRINCKTYFCEKAAEVPQSRGVNMIEDTVMRSAEVGDVTLPCVQSTVIEMKEDFVGNNVILPAPRGITQDQIPSVYLPACLRPAERTTAKVVCSYYTNSTFFPQKRELKSSQRILDDVVGISVENEIITNLPEPVRIKFHHKEPLLNTVRRTCVSWDTRKDNEVVWREPGCMTLSKSAEETECCCDHLTYFTVLVDMNPTRRVRHLEALTYISAVCCALSIVSCVVLFVWLCRQRKNHSSLVHRGLVVAIFFLLVLFVLTGTVANTASDEVCRYMGGLLHYALLSVLCWMGVEVMHTFWMMYMVFIPTPRPRIWYLLGFGVPAVLVIILGLIGDIYGQKVVKSADDLTAPYRMCWMTDTRSSLMAQFIVNIGLLLVVVSSGFVMLFLVFLKIRHRDEWRRNRVAFLSIWGLSCLFGSTWALALFSAEASETILFLCSILNSLQGFFLMLRFFALEQIQKTSKSGSEFSSTGSTRQHMLQS